MRICALLISLVLQSCSALDFKAGISFADENSAAPEVNLPNPLGILRIEYPTENNNTIFCEHISSLPLEEKGSGLNHCGFLIEL